MAKVYTITEQDLELTKKMVKTGVLPKNKEIKERVARVIKSQMIKVRDKDERMYSVLKNLHDQLWGNLAYD